MIRESLQFQSFFSHFSTIQCARYSVYPLIPALPILESLVAFEQQAFIILLFLWSAGWLCSVSAWWIAAIWLSGWGLVGLVDRSAQLGELVSVPRSSSPSSKLPMWWSQGSGEQQRKPSPVCKCYEASAHITSSDGPLGRTGLVARPRSAWEGLAGSWRTGRGRHCKLLPLSKIERGTPILPNFQGLSLVC